MTVLGLLNDSTISQTIPQVLLAAAQLNYRYGTGRARAFQQLMQQIAHVAED